MRTPNVTPKKRPSDRARRHRQEKEAYRAAAVATSVGLSVLILGAAVAKVLGWREGSPAQSHAWLQLPLMLATGLGAMVGMELWARWAHRALWHGSSLFWALHESHHQPRKGLLEANDLNALINALPAIAMCAYGWFSAHLLGSACLAAGSGITLYGMAYMFIHDGVVHRRFPVGPIEHHPYVRRVAAAHRLHHSGKYGGAPWGMFLGPQEVAAAGGAPELERMVAELDDAGAAQSAGSRAAADAAAGHAAVAGQRAGGGGQ